MYTAVHSAGWLLLGSIIEPLSRCSVQGSRLTHTLSQEPGWQGSPDGHVWGPGSA